MKRTRPTTKEEEEKEDCVYVVTWTERRDAHDSTAHDAYFYVKGVFRNQKDAEDCKINAETKHILEHMEGVGIGEDETERRELLAKNFDHYLDMAQECEYAVYEKGFECEILEEKLK